MSGVLLGVICLALGLAFWRVATDGASARPRPSAARTAAMVVGVAAPAVLVVGCLLTAAVQGRASELRLSLLRLTAEVRQFPLLIGGDASGDDLVVPRLPASLATVEPDISRGGDAPPLVLVITASDTSPPQAVIALRQGRRLTWPTALAFAEGDAVCVLAPCEHDGAAWAVLRGRALVPADWRDGEVVARPGAFAGPAMPERKTLLAFGGVNDWTPLQAIHPLRDFLPRPGPAKEDAGEANGVLADCDRWLCVGKGASRAPARSFLFQQGGFGGSAWAIILADPGARIARGGRVAPYTPPAAIALQAGIRAEIFEPRFVDGVLDGPDARRGRLQLRRSLTLAERDGKADITFATPPTEIVGRCERGAPPRRLGLETSVVGGLTADALRAAPTLPQGPACARFTHAKLDAPAGVALRTVHLALDRLATPWPAVLIVLAWTASLLLARRDLFHRRPALWTILSLLQWLLALRLLIGLAAAKADPTLNWREILGDAAVAYVAVPAALLAWARAGEPRRPGDLTLDLAPPLAAAVALAWTHRLSILALLLLAAWGLAVLWRAANTPPAKGGAPSPLAALARRRDGAPEPGSPWLSGVLLLVIVLAARLAVGAVGWKERIDLGVTVLAISVVYTPLILIGFGRLLAACEARPAGWGRPIVFWALLTMATFIVPFTVRDSGYALMFLPIGGVAAGLAWRRRIMRLPWAAPAAAAMAALLVLPILGAVGAAHADRLGQSAQMRRGLSDEQALVTLDRQAKASQNLLRLYLIAAPEALGADVSTEAQALKIWSAQLSDYTGSLLGRGYLSPANLSALKPVQATDNLTAVHLMSPFGRLATGLFLALLAGAPIALWSLTRLAPLDAQRATGLLALWCLFGAAAYMTLANLQLVPFTGRNAYLLAPTSGGDLLEGAVLVALAAWGLAERSSQAKP
ncbi:MAG: hypothetical protein JWP92_2567 [Caulobacter sp.]|nr:hypothetical protein [Caulobacter sp.]